MHPGERLAFTHSSELELKIHQIISVKIQLVRVKSRDHEEKDAPKSNCVVEGYLRLSGVKGKLAQDPRG